MVGAGTWLALFLTTLLTLSSLPPLIWEDDDRKTIPEPKEREIAVSYDFIVGSMARPIAQILYIPRHVRKLTTDPKEAQNVNAVDEVPNSSWYTNRNFLYPMSLEAITRGPATDAGPAEGYWTVVACKNEGITPGLRIKDSRGDIYLLKFDPPRHPELMSSADVIGSKFFYAVGYNVPVNSIVTFSRAQLKVPHGMVCDLKGIRIKDGKVRAIASRFLDGKPKGPFSYTGVREDDPNDVVSHEHRRELRGARVIAAFINHHDLKQLNTLDMYVVENGRKFLKHHFIDFGSTLGSAAIEPKLSAQGHEYIFDAGEILKSTLTLGLYKRRRHHEIDIIHLAIGHIESDTFEPEHWKPNLPITPFQEMTDRDAYWGAKIVAAFTDDQIRAIIRTGRYSDPAAEEKLFQVLKKRRDKTAHYWFRRSVAPLDRFRFEGDRLVFDDLAVLGGYDCRGCPKYTFEKGNVGIRITRSSPGWPEQSVFVYTGLVNGKPAVLGLQR
ncbi:MAG: hypothetical protein HY646_12730 [Acidobacteria bacterium]|nr:hypothetical protein [Acidobacteriota bacterium]